MTTRPSNNAIAQAFWEWVDKNWSLGEADAAPIRLAARAYEIDAQPCATPDNREVSGLANSEWVMVPKTPTEEMVRTACMSNLHPLAEPSRVETGHMRKALEAAIAAAPTPPRVEPVAEVVANAPYLDATHAPMNELRWFVSGAEDCFPIGTKLYTAQPAPTPDVIRDAERPVAWKRYIEVDPETGAFWTAKAAERLLTCGPLYDLPTAKRMLHAESESAAIREQQSEEKDND